MATNRKPKSADVSAVQPTAAMSLAMAFDKTKADLAKDVKRPLAQSKTKQVGLGLAIGAGAIATWEGARHLLAM